MADKSQIHWTDASWNPVTGCSKVSEGCRWCYAEALSLRYGWTAKPWTAPNAEENVQLKPERLELPLKWKAPRRIFVNSMSDLFHPLVPDDFIAQMFAVMALARQHTYQILTKRPERMAPLLTADGAFTEAVDYHMGIRAAAKGYCTCELDEWPLPNVWLGTSVERQREADERIPQLLRAPAAVRFLSCEPLLGPVDLTTLRASNGALIDCLRGDVKTPGDEVYAACPGSVTWVIVGGESGPNARPMHPDWPRALRDQCTAADVAFFYKQGSGLRPGMNREMDGRLWEQFPAATTPDRAPVRE